MRIVKVLNNSLVLALDEQGKEAILMGKGIGYHKAIGYEFRSEEIEKVFVLQDRELSKRIMELASETSGVYFELAKEIIDYAVNTYSMKLMDHIYLSLTDHLSFTAKRVKDGVVLQNFYTVEMRKFNPDEYDVGEYAVRRLQEVTGMEVSMGEAGNIAWHFINAEIDGKENVKHVMMASTVEDILNIVKYTFNISFCTETTAWSRFVIHVQLFAQRLVTHSLLPEEENSALFQQIRNTCDREFKGVERIQLYVRSKFNEELSNQEQMYLAIHLHRILEDAAGVKTE